MTAPSTIIEILEAAQAPSQTQRTVCVWSNPDGLTTYFEGAPEEFAAGLEDGRTYLTNMANVESADPTLVQTSSGELLPARVVRVCNFRGGVMVVFEVTP